MRRSSLIFVGLCLAAQLCWRVGPALAQTPSGCAELVVNGGFEYVGVWQLGASPSPPQYVNSNAHSGAWSLSLGITDGVNRQSFSSARQTVTIPAVAQSATLSFWFDASATGAPTTDYVELALLSPDGGSILAKPWLSHNDSGAWNQLVFDLSVWRGRTFQLYFNVYNDGLGGIAQMFLDDVSLVTCPGGGGGGGGLVTPAPPSGVTVTPTRGACFSLLLPCKWLTATPQSARSAPTATPQTAGSAPVAAATTGAPLPAPTASQSTPAIIQPAPLVEQPASEVIQATPIVEQPAIITPVGATVAQGEALSPTIIEVTPTVSPSSAAAVIATPSYWTDPVRNGGFEENLAYWTADGTGDAPLITDAEVHSGLRAVRLGAAEGAVEGTSSIVQEVTVPAGFSDVALDFWVYPWAAEGAGNDSQEAVLVSPDGATVARLWHEQSDARAWTRKIVPVTSYSGQPMRIQFNVYNDGLDGSTGMIVDDVSLVALGPESMPGDPNAVAPADGRASGSSVTFEPSITRIALVVTVLPPELAVAKVAADSVSASTSTPGATPGTATTQGRSVTDQWPKYWWLIPIGFFVLVVVIWLYARRSARKPEPVGSSRYLDNNP